MKCFIGENKINTNCAFHLMIMFFRHQLITLEDVPGEAEGGGADVPGVAVGGGADVPGVADRATTTIKK